jgi:hypothetical protein
MVNSGVILIKSGFWALFALILCCCACACMTAAPPADGQTDGSGPRIVDRTPRDEPAKLSFEDAWQELPNYDYSDVLNLEGLTLHQIHGMGVALNGTADTWIVGVQNETMSSLLVYDRETWNQIAWGEAFSQEIITFENLTLPSQIYQTNQKTIEDIMNANGAEVSDMDLSDGVYTISIPSSTGLSMIRFNASTGELLSQTL